MIDQGANLKYVDIRDLEIEMLDDLKISLKFTNKNGEIFNDDSFILNLVVDCDWIISQLRILDHCKMSTPTRINIFYIFNFLGYLHENKIFTFHNLKVYEKNYMYPIYYPHSKMGDGTVF